MKAIAVFIISCIYLISITSYSFGQCNISGGNLTVTEGNTCIISSSTVITGNLILEDDAILIISSGVTLTIQGNVLVNDGQEGSITIDAGAQMLVNNNMNVGDAMAVQINGTLSIDNNLNINAESGALCGNGLVNVGGDVNGGNEGETNCNTTCDASNDVEAGCDLSFNVTGSCGPTDDLCIDIGNNSLPITLLSFVVESQDNQVMLHWQTATEINNSYFQIERSQDLNNFVSIGIVDGAGNSNTILSYTFIDPSPLQGLAYYRLKQVDFDGKFSYSPIKAIRSSQLIDDQVKIFPNPATDLLEIQNKTSYQLSASIYDIYGHKVNYKSLQIEQEPQKLNLNNLSAGVYYILFSNGVSKKFIKK